MNEPQLLFPLAQYWWAYIGFILFVALMLLIDLGVFHRKSHAVRFREAAGWSVVWILLALSFNYGLYEYAKSSFSQNPTLLAIPGFDPVQAARDISFQFLTGFVLEKSLAIDNIFVFVLIFSYFGVEGKYQHRVLFYGIIGALVFRIIFISLGAVLMQYAFVEKIFGAFLLFTGAKMLFGSEAQEKDPRKNPIVRFCTSFLPVTNEFHGKRFFIVENGKWVATPLFVALLSLELSDIIFAVDSVPAIFAVTKEPFIVFTSNIFAICGLRSMYFLLASILDRFHLLQYGLAIVLCFIGLKMIWLHDVISTGMSLVTVLSVIIGSVVLSALFPKKRSAAEPPETPKS